ncbi:hypothetical protein ABZW11_07140 [Nonomuraea sp. NPDC004580]|uniref:hypothetical protein n=1 Tax=Nonomuraea sp. NPDC004580 TaxID=3154552 RepID=UPI0033B6CEFF
MSGKPPSDAETAGHMRELADVFVAGARAEGFAFDWDPAFIHHLDNYCAAFVAARPAPEVVHSAIMGAGAYLGEMIVRNCGWSWVYCTDQRAAAVESPEGLRGYPHNKVAKRIHEGSEHDLAAFFTYARTGEAPHGTTARTSKAPWWRRLRSRA